MPDGDGASLHGQTPTRRPTPRGGNPGLDALFPGGRWIPMDSHGLCLIPWMGEVRRQDGTTAGTAPSAKDGSAERRERPQADSTRHLRFAAFLPIRGRENSPWEKSFAAGSKDRCLE